MSQVRASFALVQPATGGYSNVHVNITFGQAAVDGRPNVRSNEVFVQSTDDRIANVRVDYVIVQSIIPVRDEPVTPTQTLPGFGNGTAPLRGLGITVHKKPMFNTRVSESASLNSIRSMLADYPRWDYSLNFEFLEDKSGAQSEVKRLLGCFLSCGGKAKPFMFKDPDDYQADMVLLGTADGVTVQWEFRKEMGGYTEPVGMVDQTVAYSLYVSLSETKTVPAVGPYTVTVNQAANFYADEGVKIGTTTLTKVTGSPGSNQYAVNTTTGVYTFNSAQAAANAVISYRYKVPSAGFTIEQLNKAVFSSAPPSGSKVYASCEFFYTCFFNDDLIDFEKFMHQLWQVQTLSFHSELLS